MRLPRLELKKRRQVIKYGLRVVQLYIFNTKAEKSKGLELLLLEFDLRPYSIKV